MPYYPRHPSERYLKYTPILIGFGILVSIILKLFFPAVLKPKSVRFEPVYRYFDWLKTGQGDPREFLCEKAIRTFGDPLRPGRHLHDTVAQGFTVDWVGEPTTESNGVRQVDVRVDSPSHMGGLRSMPIEVTKDGDRVCPVLVFPFGY